MKGVYVTDLKNQTRNCIYVGEGSMRNRLSRHKYTLKSLLSNNEHCRSSVFFLRGPLQIFILKNET